MGNAGSKASHEAKITKGVRLGKSKAEVHEAAAIVRARRNFTGAEEGAVMHYLRKLRDGDVLTDAELRDPSFR